MAVEKTLVVIKPDGVERNLQDDIKNRLTATGLSIVAQKDIQVDAEFALTHYDDLGARKGADIQNKMVAMMSSGPVEALIIEGENAIAEVRRIVGATEPISADPGTIRGDLSDDTYAKADEEGRAVYNLVHASDAPETAAQEIALWFPELS
ncbi:MAG: nucleoside-diphosphate kinase [Patescibacteria group bacterium]